MRKKKSLTKKQIILKLYEDGFIDGRVWWNLWGSKFKKSEIEQIDKTFRKYFRRK
ncbi:MAG: hypothetical protein AB1488_00010 [Nitrospirota bacterium]